MLKNNTILTASIFTLAFIIGGVQLSFASDIVSNDPPETAPLPESAAMPTPESVAIPTPEPDEDESSEAGFSGSYLSSQFSRSNGDIDSAIKSLQSVYKKDLKNIEVANQLMGLHLLAGHVDKAMGIASNILKNNNKEPIAALMLSLQAIKKNDAAGAAHILDKLAEEEGGQLWLPLIYAWLDVEQHKLQKPLLMEELSAEVGRAAPIVSYHLALINAHAGFTKAAIENFKYSVEDQAHPPARVMEMLIKFYEKNNSPEALKPLITKYRETNNNSYKPNLKMIDNMQAGAAEVLLTMGSIMLAADVTQDATLYLQLALYLKPDMEIATVSLAQAYSELQQYGIANELLAKILPDDPLYMDAQLYSAVNLGRLNKVDEAITKLDVIIAASPNNIDAYIAKGDLLRSQERFADAITVYQKALGTLKEEKAQHWPIFFAMGICFDKQGNWALAEKNLRHSIELSPNQPDVLNYLGYSFLLRGENFSEAKELIEKAIKKRPSDPQIMDSMGYALYLSGDYKEATMYLEMAVSLLPADSTVNEHLGDLYWRLGRKTEARFQWDRSLTYAKGDAASEEIKKKLQDGLPEKNSTDVVEKKDKNEPLSPTVTE